MARLLLLLSLLTTAHAVELRVTPLSTTPFEPQTATVAVVNDPAAPLAVLVTLTIEPPNFGAQKAVANLTVPAGGEAAAKLKYELFEPGKHKVTVTATSAGNEAAKWTGELTVGPTDALPMVFPNYYRQLTTTIQPGTGQRVQTPGGPGVVPCPAGVSPVVGVDLHNRLLAQGQPWFPIGIYTTPASEAQAKALAEAGFDVVSTSMLPPASMQLLLDRLQSWGLKTWAVLGDDVRFDTGDVAKKQERIRRLVERVGKHPALAWWETYDEPAWGGTPAWGLREGYRFVRATDPDRPLWTNHAPRNQVRTLAWYNQATDLSGCDIYPVPMPQTQSDLPNKTLAVVADETRKQIAAVAGEKPILMVLQAFAWKALSKADDPTAVYPTFAESRFMAYDAIVAGANGLLYWGSSYTPKPSRFWSDLKSLVSELAALRPVLASLPAAQPLKLTAPAAVKLADRDWHGRHVLLLVNESDTEQAATVSVEGTAAPWRALFGDPDPAAADGSLRLTLPPWGVRVLTNDPTLKPARKDFSAEAAAAAAPMAVPVEPGNPIRNPGFEAQADNLPLGWEVRFPFASAYDPTVAHSGKGSLRIEGTEPGFTPLAVEYNIEVKPDHRYRLSGWMRSDTPGVKARIYTEWVHDGFHGKVLPWTEPRAEWQQVSLDFTATPNPDGRLYVVVQIDGKGRAWFDDLKLEELP